MEFLALGGYSFGNGERCPRPRSLVASLYERARSAARASGVEAAATYLALAGGPHYLVLAASRNPSRLAVLRLELEAGECLREELWWPLILPGPNGALKALSSGAPKYMILALVSSASEGVAVGFGEGVLAFNLVPVKAGALGAVLVLAESLEEWVRIHKSMGRIDDLVVGVKAEAVSGEVEEGYRESAGGGWP